MTADENDASFSISAELEAAEKRGRETAIADGLAFEEGVRSGKLALWDALIGCLVANAVISDWLRLQLMRAYADYQKGKHDDLAEPLGVALSRRAKKSLELEWRKQMIRARVDVVAKGERIEMPGQIVAGVDGQPRRVIAAVFPKRPKYLETKSHVKSAFKIVGEEFGLKAGRVAEIYFGKQRRGKKTRGTKTK